MPNKKSAKKELRKSKKRKEFKDQITHDLKLLAKKSRKSMESGNEKEAKDFVGKTLKALDKAAQKGIIKKNTRDRKKSRLHQKLNKILASK